MELGNYTVAILELLDKCRVKKLIAALASSHSGKHNGRGSVTTSRFGDKVSIDPRRFSDDAQAKAVDSSTRSEHARSWAFMKAMVKLGSVRAK